MPRTSGAEWKEGVHVEPPAAGASVTRVAEAAREETPARAAPDRRAREARSGPARDRARARLLAMLNADHAAMRRLHAAGARTPPARSAVDLDARIAELA